MEGSVSAEAGLGAAFGILMCDVTHQKVRGVYEEFLKKTANAKEADAFDDITTKHWYPELYSRLVAAFALDGVVIPESACLMYTGKEDERPARCSTPPGQWVLGFGLFCHPNHYPVIDESFTKLADWHTWVWMS